jgi:hypothetical protein
MNIIKIIINMCCILAASVMLFTTISNLNNGWEGDGIADEKSIGYISIPIGGHTEISAEKTTVFSRSYALIPVSLSAPKMLYVESNDNGKFSSSSDVISFWLFFVVIAYGWYRIIYTAWKFISIMVQKNRGNNA